MDNLEAANLERKRDFWKRFREVEEELLLRLPYLPFAPRTQPKSRLRFQWSGTRIDAVAALNESPATLSELNGALDELLEVEKAVQAMLKLPITPRETNSVPAARPVES